MKNSSVKTEHSSEETIAFIALGSNQDDPIAQVTTAINTIAQQADIALIKQSRLYASTPYGYLEQADFINAVIKITTRLAPYPLLKILQSIEIKQNRKKIIHWGPRTIDLDILAYGQLNEQIFDLIIPHPDLENRNFVIMPWYEIEPEWILPNKHKISDLLSKLETENKTKGISLIIQSSLAL